MNSPENNEARLAAQPDALAGSPEAEIARLRGINSQLVRDFNSMNIHGARQDERIRDLEALIGASSDAYDIGVRDGYEKAVQEIDEATGGNGEYTCVVGDEAHDRHCPDATSMKARIVDRFAGHALAGSVGDGALREIATGAAIFGEGLQARVYDLFRADPNTRGDHADWFRRGSLGIMRPRRDSTAYASWLAGKHHSDPDPAALAAHPPATGAVPGEPAYPPAKLDGRCPDCKCNWQFSEPAIPAGSSNLRRCINCKSVFDVSGEPAPEAESDGAREERIREDERDRLFEANSGGKHHPGMANFWRTQNAMSKVDRAALRSRRIDDKAGKP